MKDTQVWIRISADLRKWCEKQASADSRSLSGWIAHQLQLMRKEEGKAI
jgi:hypothetical protein